MTLRCHPLRFRHTVENHHHLGALLVVLPLWFQEILHHALPTETQGDLGVVGGNGTSEVVDSDIDDELPSIDDDMPSLEDDSMPEDDSTSLFHGLASWIFIKSILYSLSDVLALFD